MSIGTEFTVYETGPNSRYGWVIPSFVPGNLDIVLDQGGSFPTPQSLIPSMTSRFAELCNLPFEIKYVGKVRQRFAIRIDFNTMIKHPDIIAVHNFTIETGVIPE